MRVNVQRYWFNCTQVLLVVISISRDKEHIEINLFMFKADEDGNVNLGS